MYPRLTFLVTYHQGLTPLGYTVYDIYYRYARTYSYVVGNAPAYHY